MSKTYTVKLDVGQLRKVRTGLEAIRRSYERQVADTDSKPSERAMSKLAADETTQLLNDLPKLDGQS